jgi:hypothetical protein
MLSNTDILLVHNVLNELLNGLPETPPVTSLTRRGLRQIADAWDDDSKSLMVAHKGLIAECVSRVLGELGDEFETRVGVSTESAEAFVQRNFRDGNL